MNARTLKRLAAAFAVLVLVWAGLSLAHRARRDTEPRLVLPSFDPKAVDHALIVRGTDTLRFARVAAGWTVNGLRADASLVQTLLGSLADTSAPTELVSEKAATHAQLGLDSVHARRVSVIAGERVVTELLVGNQGMYGNAYVRRPGEDAVFQLRNSLAEVVGRPIDEWRDRTIVDVPPDSVAAIDVRAGRNRYTLTRTGTAWRLGSHPADSALVASLLGRFHPLAADAFATPAQADSARFTAAARTVRLLGARNRPLLALHMDSTSTAVWARRDGDSTTYRLDDYLANALTPADTTLRQKPKATPKNHSSE